MSTPTDGSQTPPSSLANDLARGRTHLGNERTHLAYLRTTVSLIGFGITINRFSTYLIQNDEAPKAAGCCCTTPATPALAWCCWAGAAGLVAGPLPAGHPGHRARRHRLPAPRDHGIHHRPASAWRVDSGLAIHQLRSIQ